MRGEHQSGLMVLVLIPGSSPHARGTRRIRAPAGRSAGIIPACAGNTPAGCRRPRGRRDHPRMRGEHRARQSPGPRDRGSSPHARGTRLPVGFERALPGIIPACAGNTRAGRGRAISRRDHPRMRGEHENEVLLARGKTGSSPHARGTPTLEPASPACLRIIPACAGNTPHAAATRSSHRDHPRMRGEHQGTRQSIASKVGSSPHARGTPGDLFVMQYGTRIIPACAGNTRSTVTNSRGRWDHPRMRGEHFFMPEDGHHPKGSSPHARGTPLR